MTRPKVQCYASLGQRSSNRFALGFIGPNPDIFWAGNNVSKILDNKAVPSWTLSFVAGLFATKSTRGWNSVFAAQPHDRQSLPDPDVLTNLLPVAADFSVFTPEIYGVVKRWIPIRLGIAVCRACEQGSYQRSGIQC
jgi:hypothetical protein